MRQFGAEVELNMNLPGRQRYRQLRCNPFILISILFIWLLLLTGCFGRGEANQDGTVDGQPPPVGQPLQKTLTCSEACAINGQCGQASDGRFFVLGRSDQPNTQNHDRLFPVDVRVEVLRSEQRTIQHPGNEPVQQIFSFVNLSEEQKTGWVADWCFTNP